MHDLNNCLHVADVSLALVERQGATPELVAATRQALHAMERLTTMLLAHARGHVAAPVPVEIGAVVRETLGIMRRAIPPSVELVLDIDPRARPVRGIRAELEQLVLNLVVNACDAMPGGGELSISVRGCVHQAVLLAVADTGTGGPDVPAANANATVADAAAVAWAGASTKRSGRGLGLGIVKSVVARHDGALRITSRTMGGTMVAVMLPAMRNKP